MKPTSTGRQIAVIYGDDPYSMTMSLLEGVDAASLIPAGAAIVIKPNLVLPSPASQGATTHPQVAAAVIDYLREHGFADICIAESAWVGASTAEAAEICGYRTLCEHKNVPFYDLKHEGFVTRTVAGVPVELSRRVSEADFLINLPVLKGHCQTAVTCALKNIKGCISDRSKREFHSLGLHKPIAALNTLLPPQLVVVDGICGDLDFEEGGNPVYAGRMFAGSDPVLIDSYGAWLLGYSADEVEYIRLAEQMGVGSADLGGLHLLPLGEGCTTDMPAPTRRVRALAKHLVADSACSACYASAIHALARLEDVGLLERLGEKLYIGRGYRGKNLNNVGIGSCCRGFACVVQGCPPAAGDIVALLSSELSTVKK